MNSFHFFDLDDTLWNTNSKLAVIDKNKPEKVIYRIDPIYIPMMKTYWKQYDLSVIYNGKQYWLNEDTWKEIQSKNKKIKIEDIGISDREWNNEEIINRQLGKVEYLLNNNVKFIVDAEGDIFANNLTLAGSQNVGASTISTLIVENNSTLGDAVTDQVTFVSGDLTYNNTATSTIQEVVNAWSIATSTSVTPILSVDGSTGYLGVGTVAPGGNLHSAVSSNIPMLRLERTETISDNLDNLSDTIQELYIIVSPFLLDAIGGSQKCPGIIDTIIIQLTPSLIMQDSAREYPCYQIKCNGDANGAIYMYPTGGILAFGTINFDHTDLAYTLNGNDTSAYEERTPGHYSVDSLPAGIYSLGAYDRFGCTASESVTLTEAAMPFMVEISSFKNCILFLLLCGFEEA